MDIAAKVLLGPEVPYHHPQSRLLRWSSLVWEIEIFNRDLLNKHLVTTGSKRSIAMLHDWDEIFTFAPSLACVS